MTSVEGQVVWPYNWARNQYRQLPPGRLGPLYNYDLPSSRASPRTPETNLFSLRSLGADRSWQFFHKKQNTDRGKTVPVQNSVEEQNAGANQVSTKISTKLNSLCSEILTARCRAWLRATSAALGSDRLGGGGRGGGRLAESKSAGGRGEKCITNVAYATIHHSTCPRTNRRPSLGPSATQMTDLYPLPGKHGL
ncbi:hypothetical protein J6590_035452 [Homalodisca vitripennis]|nr:hypothetical protein J6590_035452 [Homalodisca vitripennis]